MTALIDLLVKNPLLLLFLVAALGYALGQIKVAGASFGVAAVLFVGLAFGALDQRLRLGNDIYNLGLVLFVYTVGISSGRAFFASFSRKGLPLNLYIVGLILLAAVLSLGAQWMLGIRPSLTAGLFTGSVTNASAMGAATEYLRATLPQDTPADVFNDPAVGFSIAYPIGVIGLIGTILIFQKIWKIDYHHTQSASREHEDAQQVLFTQSIAVTRTDLESSTIADLVRHERWRVVFGRVVHHGRAALVTGATTLSAGDLINATGSANELDRVTAFLGHRHDDGIELDRHEIDYRRVFVSNPEFVGIPLGELRLPQRLSALITRVRRGDTEFIPNGETRLELGDRIRVSARRVEIDDVSNAFGDSFRSLSEINILTTTIGLVLGLLLGQLTFPLPGGINLKLGNAGGPLIAALILSAVGRTGPLVWTLPYNATLTLRQFGLVLFLAAVGTRAGYDFVQTLAGGTGIQILLASATIIVVITVAALLVGRYVLQMTMGRMLGVLGGLFTQPAVLGFAADQTGDDRASAPYAASFPIALITKIIVAQLLLAVLL